MSGADKETTWRDLRRTVGRFIAGDEREAPPSVDTNDVEAHFRPGPYSFDIEGKDIVFNCPNKLTHDRATSVLTKEPGTIAWIKNFGEQSIFWDIGANVGTFALYAAIVKDCEVYAFEPVAHNFFVLQQNIIDNKIDSGVKALSIAINSIDHVSDIFMRDSVFGSALHAFGNNIDYTGKRYTESHRQGCLGISIDTLCRQFGMSVPNYVKIDVDGLEKEVVSGGLKTFQDQNCRSILVELDLNDTNEVEFIRNRLGEIGFAHDEHVPGNAPRLHPDANVYNMIFNKIQ